MDSATPNGETGTPKAPENVTPTSAPTQGNANDAAVEQLRKEKEQAEMRANQLANQLKAKEDAEAADRAKKLAEQNEFNTLYEQEKTKREALEAQIEADKQAKELAKAKTEVLAGYPDEVKALAEETGMTLASADDDAKTAFKEKLDKIQQRVGANGRVTPNNPNRPTGQPQLSPAELGKQLQNQSTFEQIVAQKPGIASMMSPKQ